MKDGIELWLSDPNRVLLTLFLFFLPTQLGKHFWPLFSFVNGIRSDLLSPTFYFSDLIIIALILLNMKNFRIVVKKIKISKINRLAFLVIVLSIFASIIFSLSPAAGLYGLIKILEYILLGLVLYLKKDILFEIIPKVLPISIIFESSLAILQFISKGSINGIFYFFGERSFNSQTPNIANAVINSSLVLRPYGTLPHPNVLAGFLLIGITFLLFQSFKKNYLTMPALFLGTIALLLSLSRVCIILFLLTIIIYAVKKYLSKDLLKQNILLILLFLITFSFLFSTISGRFKLDLSDTSIEARKLLINSADLMIKEKPIFGVGLNNFLPSLPKFYSYKESIFYLQPVHNVPLLIFSQVGLIAGIIILYFFVVVFYRANFIFKLILFQIFVISILDHYFLTIQQGQILLTFALVLALTKEFFGDRIRQRA